MKTLILGLGNPILSDDAIGLHVARALESKLDPAEVTIIESSAASLDLLEILNGYEKAIIIDAIQTEGGKVGQIYHLNPGAFSNTLHAATPHDVNFATALELGNRLGWDLPQITVLAIEVADVISFCEGCTPEVVKAIPECVTMVLQELNGEYLSLIHI